MKKLIRSILTIAMLFATQFVFSANQCPNLKVIKRSQFDLIKKGEHEGVWTAVQNKKYNTKNHWQFSLIIEANNKKQAMFRANSALKTLHYPSHLQKIDNVLVCDYKVNFPGISAIAVSKMESLK